MLLTYLSSRMTLWWCTKFSHLCHFTTIFTLKTCQYRAVFIKQGYWIVGFLAEKHLRISSSDMLRKLRLDGGCLMRWMFENRQFAYAVQTATGRQVSYETNVWESAVRICSTNCDWMAGVLRDECLRIGSSHMQYKLRLDGGCLTRRIL